MELSVTQSVVMPDLMNKRYMNLMAQLFYVITNSQYRVTEDHNDVR